MTYLNTLPILILACSLTACSSNAGEGINDAGINQDANDAAEEDPDGGGIPLPDDQVAIGVPKPPFGIDESHTMYTGQRYAAGDFDYRDSGNGPYTHYIDNSSPACTNKKNPYGTDTLPRCSMPTNPGNNRRVTLPPGSVVEIHGDLATPYQLNGFYQITADGTQDAPVFIRGFSNIESEFPQYINTDFRIAGTYLVLENLDIYDDSNFNIHPSHDLSKANRSDHIAVRNLHIHEPVGDSGDSNGSTATGEYIVYYRNHVHDNWRSETQDAHGINLGSPSKYVEAKKNKPVFLI